IFYLVVMALLIFGVSSLAFSRDGEDLIRSTLQAIESEDAKTINAVLKDPTKTDNERLAVIKDHILKVAFNPFVDHQLLIQIIFDDTSSNQLKIAALD